MTTAEARTRKRVCLLAGAGGTLGNEFCRRYASRYDIVAVYRRRIPDVVSQLQRWVDPLHPDEEVEDNAHPVYALRADLLEPGEIARVVELALERHERIDVVVNAAVHSIWGDMVNGESLLESVDLQMRTNVDLPLRLCVEVARQFWRDRREENLAARRCVVNVSSIAGFNVYTGSGQSVYAASKAALNHLTRHMAHEFGRFRVRVNATAPDSFPGLVPTAVAAASIVKLDDDPVTGRILVVGARGEQYV